MKTILLSPIGGQAMPGIIEYFRSRQFNVIGIDADPNNGNRFFVNKFITVPPVLDLSYKGDVLEIIREFEVDIFVSWLDMEIRFWNDEYLNRRIDKDLLGVFVFNFRPELSEFYDKWFFYGHLDKHGFLTPRTRILRGPGTWERLNFPIIFKPRTGTGSRDIHVVYNSDEYDYWSRMINLNPCNAKQFIAQEYIKGNEYTVDFFSDKGEMINSVIRLRIKPNGVSMGGKVIFNKAIREIIERFCEAFLIDGLNNVQLIEGKNGYFITDFNPRPSGTIMLSVNAGVDFFNNLIEKQAGKELTRYTQVRPLKMIRHLREFYYE